MIPVLYDKTGANKIGDLIDSIECYVEEERNGIFELTMVYPANTTLLDNLSYENIIVVDANDYLKNQKFRIYNTRKLMSNRIEICARHISFDLAHDWIDYLSINNQSCEYALNMIFKKSQFSSHFKGHSDIINAQDYAISETTCLNAIGGSRGSILDTFGTGAEILRDNTDIHVLNRRGSDNDVSIEYRKNLTGLEVEEDATDLVTRILPYATYTDDDSNEIKVKGSFVDSSLIKNYAHPYVKYIDYSEKFDEDNLPTASKLESLAKKEYINNKVDIPKMNYKIEFIPLSKCAGYEGLEDKINLCDTVTIRDTRYGIDTQSKVIKVTYDALRDRYESMELGEPRTTLGDVIGGTGESTQGPPGPQGPQGPAGADGSIGDFPSTLPKVPTITTKVYGFANVEVSWTFENKVYYSYELYASKTKGFAPNTFNLIFEGQASTFLHQVNPNETWYYRACAINSHGSRTEFSDEVKVSTVKITDLSNYVASAAIGDALIGELNLERGWVGELKGNYIDAKQLSVTDGNGKRTLDIDSFGNVNLDVASLKINSSSASTQAYVQDAKKEAISSANSALTEALKSYSTTSQMNSAITVAKNEINSSVSNTYTTKTEFSNMVVGGQNLVVNSNFHNKGNDWISQSGATLAYGTSSIIDETFVTISKTGATANAWSGIRQTFAATIPTNTTLTFGFEYYASTAEWNTWDSDVAMEIKGCKDGATSDTSLGRITITKDSATKDKWKREFITLTTDSKYNSVYAYIWVKKNGKVNITRTFVQEGNKATPWSLSPKDTRNSITSLQTRVNTAEQKITDQAIINTVSSTYTTKAEFNALSGDISANVADLSQIVSANTGSDVITPATKVQLVAEFDDITAIYDKINGICDAVADTTMSSLKAEMTTAYKDIESIVTTLNNTIDKPSDGLSDIVSKFSKFYEKSEELHGALTKSLTHTTRTNTTRIEQLEDTIEFDIVKKVENMQGIVDDVNTKFTFDTNGLTIKSNQNATKHIKLDNDSLDFMDGGTMVAEISDQKLTIKDAEIENQLKVDRIVMKPSDNGGLIFVYE